DVTRGRPTRVVVNDRLDVAIAAGADGVHLRGDSFGWQPVRRLMGPSFVIGCSVHSVEAARLASGADYLIAGTVRPTSSKPVGQPLLGVDGLSRIVAATRVPVLAIGGVTARRGREVAAAGGAGVAAIGLFIGGGASTCGAVPLCDVVDNIRAEF